VFKQYTKLQHKVKIVQKIRQEQQQKNKTLNHHHHSAWDDDISGTPLCRFGFA
jgi:hypothetical protein